MPKKIAAVIAGYLIFALSAFLYFHLTGVEPNAKPTTMFAVVTTLYGLCFSYLGGFVLQMIARTGNLKLNYIMAIILAGFALFSLIMTQGSHWTQILSIVVFAPFSLYGGYCHTKRRRS